MRNAKNDIITWIHICATIRGLAKWVHLTFNTPAGSLQWVAHTSLDIPLLPDVLPVVSGPGPPLSTDHRQSTLWISRLHAAGKGQGNFATSQTSLLIPRHSLLLHLWSSFSHDCMHKELRFKKSHRLDTQHLPPRWGAFVFPFWGPLPLSGRLVVSQQTKVKEKLKAEDWNDLVSSLFRYEHKKKMCMTNSSNKHLIRNYQNIFKSHPKIQRWNLDNVPRPLFSQQKCLPMDISLLSPLHINEILSVEWRICFSPSFISLWSCLSQWGKTGNLSLGISPTPSPATPPTVDAKLWRLAFQLCFL